MQNQHWQDWLNLILAVWLFLSPVVIGAPLGGVTIGNYCLVGIALASVENCLPAGRDGTRPYGSNERGIRVAEIFAPFQRGRILSSTSVRSALMLTGEKSPVASA